MVSHLDLTGGVEDGKSSGQLLALPHLQLLLAVAVLLPVQVVKVEVYAGSCVGSALLPAAAAASHLLQR